MNALIRNQAKILKCCLSSANRICTKHTTAHYRSHLVLKYRLDRSSYYLGSSMVAGRSRLLPNYAVVTSAGFANDNSMYSYNARRNFRLGERRLENASSKVEATVQTMKEKQKEKVEEILKEAAVGSASVKSDTAGAQVAKADPPKAAVIKKPLKTRIWEEIVHYYHGFRLLVVDINICRKLLWRVLNGKTLTRRENKLLVRTTSDLFRLIPFSVFIIVPFMELLLPLFIKFFPGMLPSTFQTAKEREDKLKQSLQVRLEMAKFLQKTLDEMAVQHKEHKSEEAKQFAIFFQKIKDPNEYVTTEEIIKYAKRFDNELTIDSLSRDQLVALSRVLEVNTMGTTNMLRFQLRLKLRSLAADDRVISREGVSSLDLFELQQACKARGMRAYGLTAERLRAQLQEWIDLSLNEKVPPTLLLLSRAMLISDDTTTSEKLKETIRVLPDAVAAQTKAAIGELEGKIDNKTKIEIIKEEERLIREEREEELEVEKAKEEVEKAKAEAEILLDTAPFVHDINELPQRAGDIQFPAATTTTLKSEVFAEKSIPLEDTKQISSKHVELLTEALKTLSSDKNKLMVEKETIKDLKEEMADYKEDVEELREVRDVVDEPVHESRAAKRLFKKVNTMIGKLDKVLEDLEQKNKMLEEKLTGVVATELTPEQAEFKRKEEEIVRVDELVHTIKKLQQTSNDTRLQQIEGFLSQIDADKDGVITVDEVLKVVETIGREGVNLDEKQLGELITLLDKETKIEAEVKIEKALAKSIKEAKKIEDTKIEEELKDIAPDLVDKATDLNLNDAKCVFKAEKCKPEVILRDAAELQKEKLIPKADISAAMPSAIPTPPPTTSTQQIVDISRNMQKPGDEKEGKEVAAEGDEVKGGKGNT